ncbi:MAG: 50S ribosomal protein L24 [Gammaproteobacteria bacterium]|nr:50S ribosomal protein L24 [Gammaproteobacteria bacterium]
MATVKKKREKIKRCRLKKGDEIIVISGDDKGKQGAIEAIIRRANRVMLRVKEVNMVKKHVRPNPNTNEEGGIVSKEALIDASNVKIFNPNSNKGHRIGMKTVDDGGKMRCFKSDGELTEIEV